MTESFSIKCCDVPTEHIPFIWPKIEKYIAATLAKDPGGRFLPIDVFEILLTSKTHRLWIAYNQLSEEFDGFVITEIMQWPRARELRMWTIGGRHLPKWRTEMREMIEAYARAEGCAYIAMFGRRAFSRMPGYRQMSHVSIFKEL